MGYRDSSKVVAHESIDSGTSIFFFTNMGMEMNTEVHKILNECGVNI